jgi:NAD(P)-dependent dehydrogenase (short-subunit alcohol dehydrogenase family)
MSDTSADMHGKVALVTGATSGIGEATARGLAAVGATVVVVGRNEERGQAAVERIRTSTGAPGLELLLADLSRQDDVRALASQVKDRFDRLDVLINNAGVDVGKRSVTADGLELTFAVNYLAPFLLTNLLLDMLEASAPSRIVNVASSAYRGAQIDFDDLQSERRFGQSAYNNSKLALVLFTYDLARRLAGTGVTANCVDPGFVRTGLGSTMAPGYRLVGMLMWPFMATAVQGAKATVFAASSPELTQATGAYLKHQRRLDTGAKTHDLATAERLWQVSEDLVAGTASS